MFRILWVSMIFLVCATEIYADRSGLRNQIQAWGNCRVVAITETGGNVAIAGQNAYSTINAPHALNNALRDINSAGHFVKDVTLTERGNWLVIFGTNGFAGDGVPAAMINKLREYGSTSADILSASFNDNGEWVIVARDRWDTSSADLANWISQGQSQGGAVLTVSLSSNSAAAVFDRAYNIRGNAPQGLLTALNQVPFKLHFIKIAGSSWFFSDVNGSHSFNM